MVAGSCLLVACGPTAPTQLEGGVTSDPSSSSTSSSTASGETDAGESEAGSEEGCFFEDCDDMVSEALACDPYIQDCPEGQKCVPYDADPDEGVAFWACVDILGQVPAGEPCVYEPGALPKDDCDGESFCQGARPLEGDGPWLGICSPFCLGDPSDPTCPENHECTGLEFAPPEYCAQQCIPLLQEDCAEGSTCQWSGARFECMAELEQLPTGLTCGELNDCAAGNICVIADVVNCEADNCCASYCNLEDGDGPCQAIDPEYVCVEFFEQGWPGDPSPLDVLGVCVLPGG